VVGLLAIVLAVLRLFALGGRCGPELRFGYDAPGGSAGIGAESAEVEV
jgi:hypothetical protein